MEKAGNLATHTVQDLTLVFQLSPFGLSGKPWPFVQLPVSFINRHHSLRDSVHATIPPSIQPLISSGSSALNGHHHNSAVPIGIVKGICVSQENIYPLQPRPPSPKIPIASTFPTDSPLHSPNTPMTTVRPPMPPNEIATTSTLPANPPLRSPNYSDKS